MQWLRELARAELAVWVWFVTAEAVLHPQKDGAGKHCGVWLIMCKGHGVDGLMHMGVTGFQWVFPRRCMISCCFYNCFSDFHKRKPMSGYVLVGEGTGIGGGVSRC